MSPGYRSRAVHSDLCLGVLNASAAEWAPAGVSVLCHQIASAHSGWSMNGLRLFWYCV